MSTTWVDVHIEAGEKVFALWADPRNWMKVDPDGGFVVEDVHMKPEGGTTYRAVMKVAGVPVHIEGRHVEVVPNERIVEEVSGHLMGTFVYTFTPEGTGTRFRTEHSPADVGRIPVLGHLIESGMAHVPGSGVARVKAYLETGDAGAADRVVMVDMLIEAPVEKVFGFMANPANWNRLAGRGGDFTDVVVTPEGVGTSYRMVSRVAGAEIDFKGRFTEVVPDERIVDDTTGSMVGRLMGGTFVYLFRPEGAGTRLRIEHSPAALERIPLLGRVIESQEISGHEQVFREAKALLEGGDAA